MQASILEGPMWKNMEARVYLSNMKIWGPKNIVELASEGSLKSNLRWTGMHPPIPESSLSKIDYLTVVVWLSGMIKEVNEHIDKGPKE